MPKEELHASAVQLRWYPEKLMWEAYSEPLLLHKRRTTNATKEGSARADLCHDCYKCLTKQTPEMPTSAFANGRWLGRDPEIMRSMPYGHRLLLPVRRVILTRVIFTNDVKNPWERSHSQKGLDGVTVVVQQASAVERVLEYPPKDLGETFQAVFAGLDPTDTRKAQQFPIHKELFLRQHEFLQKYSVPNKIAVYNSEEVDKWRDGETPPCFKQAT